MNPPKLSPWAEVLVQAVFWLLILFLASGLANVLASADDWTKLR